MSHLPSDQGAEGCGGAQLFQPQVKQDAPGGRLSFQIQPRIGDFFSQFSQGHGGLEVILRSRTEGHASDIDLTCSRLIVAHLPTGRTTHKGALSDAPSYRLTVSTFSQNGGTRLLEVLSLDLYLDVQIGVTFSQNAGDYHLELAEYQVSVARMEGILGSSLLGVCIYHTWGKSCLCLQASKAPNFQNTSFI